jgi:hypothetical protein
MLDDSGFVALDVKAQGAGFTSKAVNLMASYAGTDITATVTVVPPAGLPVAPLVIEPVIDNDPCAQQYVAGGRQDFVVKNPTVLLDRTGLSYTWTVTGAMAQNATSPTLTISPLPAPGSMVTVSVTLTNVLGIQAHGTLQFTTATQRTGLKAEVRRLNCSLGQLKAINQLIPPNVPVEEMTSLVVLELLNTIEAQSQQTVAAAERIVASVEATRAILEARG